MLLLFPVFNLTVKIHFITIRGDIGSTGKMHGTVETRDAAKMSNNVEMHGAAWKSIAAKMRGSTRASGIVEMRGAAGLSSNTGAALPGRASPPK